jgi:glycolate oxidase FAD binding subunit
MNQWAEQVADQIRQAISGKQILTIRGGGSKHFYGNTPQGEVLDTSGYRGIIEYQPGELTLTARAGTPLAEIEQVLDARQQMLPFEPPHFGEATLGGCVASALSGPRRPYSGAVRDAVLGVRMIDGTGQWLNFGGKVIKNVAGYDVSRMVVGSMGTLGVLAEVCVRVLPRPECERTLALDMAQHKAVLTMNQWAGLPVPLSATTWRNGQLLARLSGTESAVRTAMEKLGGEEFPQAETFWQALKEQQLPEFDAATLWRVSVPSTTPVLESTMARLVEWGGSVRWLAGDGSAQHIRNVAVAAGGHATLFRGRLPAVPAFTPLPAPLMAVHNNIRHVFDPHGVFDAGRLYP